RPTLFDVRLELRRGASQDGRAKLLVLIEIQRAKLGIADAPGIFQYGLEYRLELTGRARDDLQHLGGGGLPLQRLTQLVEQPRVLDGDDGLAGEILDQLDLLLGEWADLLAVNDDGADQLVVLEHRHTDDGSRTAEPGRLTGVWIRRAVGAVSHLL